jgi:hypothetical protein
MPDVQGGKFAHKAGKQGPQIVKHMFVLDGLKLNGKKTVRVRFSVFICP